MDYGGGGSEPVEPSLAHDAATSSSSDDNDNQGSGDGDDSLEGGGGVRIELTTVKFPGCFFVISSRLTKKDTKKKKTKCFIVGCLSERQETGQMWRKRKLD